MTILSWHDQYLIGNWIIDEEHRQLFEVVNEFHSHWTERRDTKEISIVLNRLIQYAENHFLHEEKIMEEENYPKLPQHQQEHAKLVESVFALYEEFCAKKPVIASDIQKFCKHWLVDHIVYSDYDFRDFLALKKVTNTEQGSATELNKPGP